MSGMPSINFDNSYARDLEGFYAPWKGDVFPAPSVVKLNEVLAGELGLDPAQLASPEGAAVLTGAKAPDGARPLAMAYAGHQFGGFSPQLGDGRALLIGEIIDTNGKRRDVHLKGSGRTPFSRGGDGKAVLGPVLREYLIGEAMHALGIPTTRALAASLTGENVQRNGREPGAVLARIAASHIRVGTFQFFAARGETDRLRQLADYAIARHYPEAAESAEPYLEFFSRVCRAQASLIAKWMSVGFVHGVMNTDNMTISGETIDYGPCAFIDAYDPRAVYSSIDHQGRYAYGNQPAIAQWNLTRFAETLIDLIDQEDNDRAVQALTDELNAFPAYYREAWLMQMRAKMGLTTEQTGDPELAEDFLTLLDAQKIDFTKAFRALSSVARGKPDEIRAMFGASQDEFARWLERYTHRLEMEGGRTSARADAMNRVNPIYIPRNHKVEAALKAATKGDMQPFERLLSLVSAPFGPVNGANEYAEPAPADFGHYTTYCGT